MREIKGFLAALKAVEEALENKVQGYPIFTLKTVKGVLNELRAKANGTIGKDVNPGAKVTTKGANEES